MASKALESGCPSKVRGGESTLTARTTKWQKGRIKLHFRQLILSISYLIALSLFFPTVQTTKLSPDIYWW